MKNSDDFIQYQVLGCLKIIDNDKNKSIVYAKIYDTNRFFSEESIAIKFYKDRLWDMQGVCSNFSDCTNCAIIGELRLLGFQESGTVLRWYQFP